MGYDQKVNRRSVRQERIAKGQCPNCGEESAPYFLCSRCRQMAKVGRILRRAHKAGGVGREVRKDGVYWTHRSTEAWNATGWRAEPGEDDKRLRPRLGRVAVDVEKELVALLVSMGRPATTEEIVAAWGRLREKRRVSIASDMATIIAAQRKREARARKRAGLPPQCEEMTADG